ncbi:tRNA (N6-threonylcarbamoyladenosine(37)-N6)-methyltransferase TrmO [Chloroflexota bacterium]|nr:tRNA (N6-threonylcarbamoyladenosine(37)-N6)-methyltransferase TrmO [Chloroflexota bacterium]
MKLTTIGIIHSPYKQRGDAPRQGRLAEALSEIEVYPEFGDALISVEHLSHLIVLYWQDRSDRTMLKSCTPFSEDMVGIFASRSPNRPNPIAFCVAEIVEIKGNIITVRGLDALDNSPLLDMKVYSTQIDCVPDVRTDLIPPAYLASSHEH